MHNSPAAVSPLSTQAYFRRLHLVFQLIGFAGLALCVIYALIGADLTFCALNFLILSQGLLLFYAFDDKNLAFIYSHAAWLFSFLTLLYSATHFRLANEGLYDGVKSIALVALLQTAATIVGLVHAIFTTHLARSQLRLRRKTKTLTANYPTITFIAIGLLGLAIPKVLPGGLGQSLSETVNLLYWLGMASHLIRRGSVLPLDRITVASGCLLTIVAALTNERTTILEFIMFIGVAHLALSRRAITLKLVVFAYLVTSIASVFSSVLIEARLQGGRESDATLQETYFRRFTDPETWVSALVPFYKNKADIALANVENSSGFRTDFFEGSASLINRITLLPQLDIIIPYLNPKTIDWSSLKNVLLSALPSLGQDKNLIYSDELTWDLGIRDRGNVGRPMITTLGELYSMAGAFPAVAINVFLIALFALEYQFACRVCGSRLLVSLLMPRFYMYTLITTTALSSTVGVVRALPEVIVVLWLIKPSLQRPAGTSHARRLVISDADGVR